MWEAPEMVGWVLPAEAGGMIAGLQSGLHRFDPASGEFTALARVDSTLPANRLNDAGVDAAGRIWFGTMDNDEMTATGRLYCWDGTAVTDAGTEPVTITNGPAITPAGDRLYHVDTLGKQVTVHAIGADGTLGTGKEFLRFGPDDGHPDGAICDAEGGLWIGFYGGWEARRFAPDGTITDRVRFPVANVTKVALGGADGRTAWATTARQGLDAAALAAQPLAGDTFTFRVLVPGTPLRGAR
jgi:D-xylonolactonase